MKKWHQVRRQQADESEQTHVIICQLFDTRIQQTMKMLRKCLESKMGLTDQSILMWTFANNSTHAYNRPMKVLRKCCESKMGLTDQSRLMWTFANSSAHTNRLIGALRTYRQSKMSKMGPCLLHESSAAQQASDCPRRYEYELTRRDVQAQGKQMHDAALFHSEFNG